MWPDDYDGTRAASIRNIAVKRDTVEQVVKCIETGASRVAGSGI